MIIAAIILIGFLLVLAWGWRRVYRHRMHKENRPVVAHMLGFLLGVFPAQFFLYAAFSTFETPWVITEPVTPSNMMLMWLICMISMLILYRMTRMTDKGANSCML